MTQVKEQRFNIAGSAPSHQSGGKWVSADPNLVVSVTLVIRRPAMAEDMSGQLLSGTLPAKSRDEMEKSLSADAADLEAVRNFTREHQLTVVTESAAARTVRVTGAIAQMDAAFGVDVKWRIDEQGRKYLSYTGQISLPETLKGVVQAVLGLDQRPAARPATA